MGGIRFSPRARRDLDDIWGYSIRIWGAAQAEHYLRQVFAAARTIAENPMAGRNCDEIRPGYRKLPVGVHVIFYRLEQGKPVIMRILHGHMDVDARL